MRRGGAGRASPVWPGGSFSDSQGPGGHMAQRRVSPKELRFCGEGRVRNRGICSSREGGLQEKRRNRLMLCRTPRVFLSGAITSTFRQEQELGGKQRRA